MAASSNAACLVLILPHPPNPSNCSSAFSSVVFVIDALSNDFHTHRAQIFVRTQCGRFSGSFTAALQRPHRRCWSHSRGASFCSATRLPSSGVVSCCRGQINQPKLTSGSREKAGREVFMEQGGLLIDQRVHLLHWSMWAGPSLHVCRLIIVGTTFPPSLLIPPILISLVCDVWNFIGKFPQSVGLNVVKLALISAYSYTTLVLCAKNGRICIAASRENWVQFKYGAVTLPKASQKEWHLYWCISRLDLLGVFQVTSDDCHAYRH